MTPISKPDFSKYQFRCSSLGDLMTDPRTKGEFLSETAKKKLVEIYVEETYGRRKDVYSKYLQKGLQAEEDSITLYSRVKKKIYFKNDFRLYNEHLTGMPDLFDGVRIQEASLIIDTKSSWDIFSFFASREADLHKAYYYQLMGYMALTGAARAIVAYCLVDTPSPLIEAEKKRLWYALGQPGGTDANYLEGCKEIERNMTFGDVPMSEKVHEKELVRDEKVISAIYERVQKCRHWLASFQREPQDLVNLLKEIAA